MHPSGHSAWQAACKPAALLPAQLLPANLPDSELHTTPPHLCCPKQPPVSRACRARAAAEKANSPIEVFEMRLDSRKGLLYASTRVQRGGAADLAFGGPPASAASYPGPDGGGGRGPSASDVDVSPLSGDAGGDEGGEVTPQINTNWWLAIRSTQSFPWRAVGYLKRTRNGASIAHCSGSLYGPRMVATAAHCLYNRDAGTWTTGATFSPNHYRTSNTGTAQKPYGTHTVKSFFWLTGWVTETSETRAFW